MKFCWITLSVKSMEDSLKFYQEVAGLAIDRRFSTEPGTEIVFLGNGETKIELIYNEKNKDVNIGQDISIGFEIKSVDEMLSKLKEKGINIHSGPFQPNPHVKFFFLLDPNGLKVQFVESN